MKRSSEIGAITRRFHGSQSDSETLRRLFSNSPDLVCVGTHDPWFHGPDEVLADYGVENEVLDGQFNEPEILFVESFENGDTGWSTGQVRYRTGEDNVVTQRLSLVFTLDSGVWRIVHMHTSVPVSHEELFGVELSRTLSDLLASINQESEAATFEDMGLSVATIVVHGDDYLGLTVHKAARVAAAAAGGQILASATTAGMVNPNRFEFGDPITVELKGLSGPHQSLPVHWTEQRD